MQLELYLTFIDINEHKEDWKLSKLNSVYELANDPEIISLKNQVVSKSLISKLKYHLNLTTKYNKITHVFDKPGFHPQSEVLNIRSSSYIEGWCTKPEYFNEYRPDLLKLMTPKFKLSNKYYNYLNKILLCNSVSIHVRRKDYLNNIVFRNLDSNYYQQAIAIFSGRKKIIFILFFQMTLIGEKNFIFKGEIVYVESANENSDLEDFF